MNDNNNCAPVRAPHHAPTELAKLPGWLIWRYEASEGETKPRKVPYYAAGGKRHGVQGRPEDRAALVTFEAAKAAAARRGFDGIGLALMPDFGITALDFDHCMIDGAPHLDVERLVADTYAEYSPSGQGVRAFFRGDLGDRKAHGEPFGFEVFSSKGFVTVTGQSLDITDLLGTSDTVAPLTNEVRAYAERRFGRRRVADADDDWLNVVEQPRGLSDDDLKAMLKVLDPDMAHAEWLNVGMALHHETQGEGFDLWDAWSSNGSKYPSEDALRKRWESFGRDETRRQVTVGTLIKMAQAADYEAPTVASAAEFEALTVPTDKPLRFRFEQAGEFIQHQAPGWLVKGVLPRAELIVVYGESGSGKSFLALDMCMAIARGLPWQGQRVKQGAVAYIVAEGGGGFRKRLAAYSQRNEIELSATPIHILSAAPNLLEKDDALELVKAIKETGKPALVVVDTFAQVTPGGDENAGKDMGKALKHCQGIHRATGATVVLIHHSGKDKARGARGWSGLRAAVDAEIEVTRSDDYREAKVTKQKDGEEGQVFPFRLGVVQIGIDEDGDPIDSCVVEFEGVSQPEPTYKPRGKNQEAVFQLINSMANLDGTVRAADVIHAAAMQVYGRSDDKGNMKRTLESVCESAGFNVQNGIIQIPHSSNLPQTANEE